MIKCDLQIIRGDTQTIEFSLEENNIPIDLTGSTVFFTVKSNLDDTDEQALISKEITVHTAPLLGETEIELTSEDTDIDPGKYYYDIQVKYANDTIASIKYRQLEILADVTRRIE